MGNIPTRLSSLNLCIIGRHNCGVAYTSNFDLAAHIKLTHESDIASSTRFLPFTRLLVTLFPRSLAKRGSARPSKHKAVDYVHLGDESEEEGSVGDRRRRANAGSANTVPSPKTPKLPRSEIVDIPPELGSISPAQSETDVIVPKNTLPVGYEQVPQGGRLTSSRQARRRTVPRAMFVCTRGWTTRVLSTCLCVLLRT